LKLLLENWREYLNEDWRDTSWQNDDEKATIGEIEIQFYKIFIEKEKFKEINETEYHEILINHTTPYSPFDILENKSLLLENNFGLGKSGRTSHIPDPAPSLSVSLTDTKPKPIFADSYNPLFFK